MLNPKLYLLVLDVIFNFYNMKTKLLFLSLFLLFVIDVKAQDLDSITYEQANNLSFFENIKNGINVKRYTTANGTIINLKDTLIIGNPALSNQKVFEYITLGKPASFDNVLFALNGQAPIKLGMNFKGMMFVVEEMKVYHYGSKKKPLSVSIILSDISGKGQLISASYELAYTSGELKPKNQPLTREQAIAKLKESKDLLDLDMIKQADYDKIKAELTKIILKNQ